VNKPQLVTYNLASLDGRLSLSQDTLLLFGDERWTAAAGSSDDAYRWVKTTFQPQALLEGSGSFVQQGAASEALPAVAGNNAELYTDFLPDAVVKAAGRRWMTVTDRRGAVRWFYKEFPGEEWAGWHLLVLVSKATPPEYLAYLRRESIPYLVSGEVQVDLAAALAKMVESLGVTSIVSTGGGRLNGALLRAGLVDQVVIEYFPVLIGGTGTPALFTTPDLLPGELPTHLALQPLEALPNGHLRITGILEQEMK
jgi:2,5-diamino-6-(ribosylamino)-4(3H)-pyrimidinone 5'-phosphate reductase